MSTNYKYVAKEAQLAEMEAEDSLMDGLDNTAYKYLTRRDEKSERYIKKLSHSLRSVRSLATKPKHRRNPTDPMINYSPIKTDSSF